MRHFLARVFNNAVLFAVRQNTQSHVGVRSKAYVATCVVSICTHRCTYSGTCEEADTQTTHMQKSFVEFARRPSVIFGTSSPLHSHQHAHFLQTDIKNKVFISSSHSLFMKLTILAHWLLIGPKLKAIYQSVRLNGNQAGASRAVT